MEENGTVGPTASFILFYCETPEFKMGACRKYVTCLHPFTHSPLLSLKSNCHFVGSKSFVFKLWGVGFLFCHLNVNADQTSAHLLINLRTNKKINNKNKSLHWPACPNK